MRATVVVGPDGTIRFVHDDDVAEALSGLGRSTTKRASNVEPDGDGGWTADLAPIGGPVLGPFARRREALKAEVNWLREHGTPLPR